MSGITGCKAMYIFIVFTDRCWLVNQKINGYKDFDHPIAY